MEKIMKSLEWMIERVSQECGISRKKAMEAIAISLNEGNYQEDMLMDVYYVIEDRFNGEKAN